MIGLPGKGTLQETFNSDDALFGGGGRHHTLIIITSHEEFAGQPFRAVIDLPPLSAVYFDYDEEESIIT